MAPATPAGLNGALPVSHSVDFGPRLPLQFRASRSADRPTIITSISSASVVRARARPIPARFLGVTYSFEDHCVVPVGVYRRRAAK